MDSTPLKPNDILIPGDAMECQQGYFLQDEISKKSWRTQQFLIECFWRRFLNEYIPTLLLKSKWIKEAPNLKVGDVVFLKTEEIRKGKWPLGVIKEVYPGPDGIVRVADVLTNHGTFKKPLIQLSLCKF